MVYPEQVVLTIVDQAFRERYYSVGKAIGISKMASKGIGSQIV